MKHSILLAIVAAILWSVAVFAAEEIVSADAEGWGATREEAIQAACVEGVKKINGFLFATENTRQTSVSQHGASTNNDVTRTTTVASDSSRIIHEQVKAAIRGYDVFSIAQNADGQWHAVLNVKVLKYKTPGIDPNTRRHIVVAPLGTRVNAYSVGSQNVVAKETAGDLRDIMEKFLVQSRRFTVLGRKDFEALLQEKQLILNEASDVGELAKIGATLGTDYILCGEIKDLVVLTGVSKSLFTDAVIPRVQRARIDFTYRIVVMPTAQVKWAGEAVIDLDAETCKAMRGDAAAAYNVLLDSASRKVCAEALGNIYPVRAMEVLENGEIVLNQGGELHLEGELLDAYRLGKKIVDAYAAESLGRAELRIATIQVIRVEAKLSYARIVDGEVSTEDIKAGVLCRPSRAVIVANEEYEEDTIKSPTRSEGVRLPFD